MIDTPTITQTTARQTAVIHLTIPRAQIRTVMGPAHKEVIGAAESQGIGPEGPWFSHHFKMSPEQFDFEVGVPVSAPPKAVGRVTASELPAKKVARTVYHGGYEGLPGGWGEFDAWITREELEIAGDLWEIYAVGPETTKDPSAWRTELYRPLKG